MRGRRPRGVELAPEDIPALEALAHNGKTEQRVARRVRILLEMHEGQRTQQVSDRTERDPATIWRVCRRYEERGVEAVYDAPRSGRPVGFSPPHADAD
jgi:transposase